MKRTRLLTIQLGLEAIAAVAVLIYCAATGGHLLVQEWFLTLMFIGAGVAIAQPIIVVRAGLKGEFDAATMFMVAGALLVPTQLGTLAWAIGVPIGWAIRGELRPVRVLDTATQILACFTALSVAHLVGSVGFSPRDLLGAGIAGLVFDPFTLLMISVLPWAHGRAKFWPYVFSCLKSELSVWPFLVCCGLLLGALGSSHQWTLLLAIAPLALVFLASRARVAASEDRTRLDGLLQATNEILGSVTIASVIQAATIAADDLFAVKGCRIDTESAGDGELGVEMKAELVGRFYLVATRRDNMMFGYSDQDQKLLETLASVTASALSKAAQHEHTTIQAKHDPLTNLANRRAFEEQVQAALGGGRFNDSIGIIFADLDKFKQINDEHGHEAGDEVLIETAQRLRGAVRDADLVARLGGDEFTVLLRGIHNADEAGVVAERILKAMRQPFLLPNGVEFLTTSSVGVALGSDYGKADADKLLHAADAAMYVAKRDGKDCWRLADPEAASELVPAS